MVVVVVVVVWVGALALVFKQQFLKKNKYSLLQRWRWIG